MPYRKVRQPKLADGIVAQLEQMILEGSLVPGQKLPPERELAVQFDVSRPSLREAIQRLEAKGLLRRRQGGGTFVEENLRESFSDPLFELLSKHSEAQFDLLEFRHALEGISAYYAAMRGTEADRARISDCHQAIVEAQAGGDAGEEAKAVAAFYLAVTEASHNVVLLHLVRGMGSLLEQNIRHNFEQLYKKTGVADKLNSHRKRLLEALLGGEPEAARDACHQHLAFIEETLLEIGREDSRIQRSMRRSQQSND